MPGTNAQLLGRCGDAAHDVKDGATILLTPDLDVLPYIPDGAPRALSKASFAAKRAAREGIDSSRSPAVKSRWRSEGLLSRVCLKRSPSTMSIPTSTITM
jgi:hypothetical protein